MPVAADTAMPVAAGAGTFMAGVPSGRGPVGADLWVDSHLGPAMSKPKSREWSRPLAHPVFRQDDRMSAHRPALRSLTTAAALALTLTLTGCGDDETSTTT